MDIRQRINRFNTENRPFYIVDHDSGEYSLCLAFSFLDGEYKEFGQDAFNRYALEINEPVVDGRGMFTHGSGYEWQAVFEKAFEGGRGKRGERQGRDDIWLLRGRPGAVRYRGI